MSNSRESVLPAAAGASAPFQAFHADLRRHEGSRAEIDATYRASEPECVTRLAAAAALPDAHVQLLSQIGHHLPRRAAPQIAAAITDFLADLDSRPARA